jgi:hypothetical protein
VALDLIAQQIGESSAHGSVHFADDDFRFGRGTGRATCDQSFAYAHDDAFTHVATPFLD